MKIFWELFTAWFKMGLFTFGGGYAMLPLIQKEVIDKYHWATEDEIMDYYAIGQCTPGIIAVNTATFVGYKVKGIAGGIVATLGVVSPSLVIITLISTLISNFSSLAIVQHALQGIEVAVCVLMVFAIAKMYKKGVENLATFLIFVSAFILSYFTSISTVILVVLAGTVGYAVYFAKQKNESEEPV